MAFTVDKMLQLREFSDCCLVAGAAGKTRVIRYVDTMEIPDITPWLKQDELLLTTGYSIAGHMDQMCALLDAMREAGSAGLAIKTRFIGGLPREILQRAEQYELPLIVIPDDKAFIPLINAIGNCLADENNKLLLFSLSVSKEINAAQQSEDYIRSIEQIIYRHLGLPVVLVDFLLLPYGIYPPDTSNPLAQDGFKERLLQHMNGNVEPLFILPGCGDPAVESLIVQKISFKNMVTGYIVLPVPKDSGFTLGGEDITLLNYTGDALAFYLFNLQPWGRQVRQRDYTLYASLVSGNSISNDIISHWISQYNWPAPPLNLITFDLTECTQRFGNPTEPMQLQIIWVLHSFFEDNRISCVGIPYEDSIRCIISAHSRATIGRILSEVLEKLRSDLNLLPRIAISTPIQNYMELIQKHREAYLVIQIGLRLDMQVAFAEELTMELALLQGADNASLRAFSKATLSAVQEYDAANHTELLRTAQALVDHMGIHTQTAQALYLHRNTLQGRIRRIETLTGLDLSRSDDLYKISFALKIRRLLGDSGF